ncbi:hypothetical protein [Streptomyces sp. SD15]
MLLRDLAVPFTSNQGEQDIRRVKVQVKTSGGRRPLDGANRRLLVRSCLSTARKHGQNSLAVLRDVFTGKLWLPPLRRGQQAWAVTVPLVLSPVRGRFRWAEAAFGVSCREAFG